MAEANEDGPLKKLTDAFKEKEKNKDKDRHLTLTFEGIIIGDKEIGMAVGVEMDCTVHDLEMAIPAILQKLVDKGKNPMEILTKAVMHLGKGN